MSDRTELTAEISQKLDELVDHIAGSHEASDDLRRELRAHLEDKAAAYLSGAERLDEADVLLLVQKHFGDTRQLRGLLGVDDSFGWMRAAAGEAFTWIFYRRVAAVIVAVVIASFVGQAADLLWTALIPAQPKRGDGAFFYSQILIGTPALQSLVLVILLNWWANATTSPWFVRGSPRTVGITAAIALGARWIFPAIVYQPNIPPFFVHEADLSRLIATLVLIQFPTLIWVLCWVAWRGEATPKTRRAIVDSYVAALLCAGIGPFIAPLWAISSRADHLSYHTRTFPPRTPLYLIGLPYHFAIIGLALVVGYFIIMIGRTRRARNTLPLQPA